MRLIAAGGVASVKTAENARTVVLRDAGAVICDEKDQLSGG